MSDVDEYKIFSRDKDAKGIFELKNKQNGIK